MAIGRGDPRRLSSQTGNDQSTLYPGAFGPSGPNNAPSEGVQFFARASAKRERSSVSRHETRILSGRFRTRSGFSAKQVRLPTSNFFVISNSISNSSIFINKTFLPSRKHYCGWIKAAKETLILYGCEKLT